MDVLFIFDCCYSYAACRAPTVTGRVVEVIATSDDTSPQANAPPHNTVTGKRANEIRRRLGAGNRFIEFVDVVQALRARENAVKKPTHGLKLGTRSICLPFSGTVNPSTIEPTVRAVFSVHISNNISQQELDNFVAWTRSLPPYASLSLEGVYPTGSMCIILSSAYAVYSKLASMRGYRFIAETTGPNLLKRDPAPTAYVPPTKENMPVGKPFH